MDKRELEKIAKELVEILLPERWDKEFQEKHGIITCPICTQRTCGYQTTGKCTECGYKIDHYMPK